MMSSEQTFLVDQLFMYIKNCFGPVQNQYKLCILWHGFIDRVSYSISRDITWISYQMNIIWGNVMFVIVKNIHILPWPSSVSDKENQNHYFYMLDGFSVCSVWIRHYVFLSLTLVLIEECLIPSKGPLAVGSPLQHWGNLNDVHGRPDGEVLVGMMMCNAC